jgi:hypothetical protein
LQDLDEWQRRALFVTDKLNEYDPIWGQAAHVYKSAAHGWIVISDRSGSFTCGPNLREILWDWSEDEKARLTTWIIDQNRAGERFPGMYDASLIAARERRPLRFSAKIDRLFLYLESRRYRVGQTIIVASGTETPENVTEKHRVMSWTEATTEAELFGFMSALDTAGLTSKATGNWQATAEGLLRLDALDAQGPANDQAFVAMWFSKDTEEAYHQGIVPGVADAGYRAFRIDQKEHANKIDDEIVAEIRRSRFLIADFTCGVVDTAGGPAGIPRGGVYFEAGLAQGLNMPVIWAVREDQIGLVHFDTRQFNHITWTDPADLRVKLYRRVAAVLGHFGQDQPQRN